MIKEAQSKQEKDIIGRYIKQITQKLTEQDAAYFPSLQKVKIVLPECRIYLELHLLHDFACFRILDD